MQQRGREGSVPANRGHVRETSLPSVGFMASTLAAPARRGSKPADERVWEQTLIARSALARTQSSPGARTWSVHTQRSPNATWHPGLSEGDERTRTAGGGFADPWLNHLPTSPESGRRDSNPRLSAWEADILPLNYSRGQFSHAYSTETPIACQARDARAKRVTSCFLCHWSSGRPSRAVALRVVMAAISSSESSRSAAR